MSNQELFEVKTDGLGTTRNLTKTEAERLAKQKNEVFDAQGSGYHSYVRPQK